MCNVSFEDLPALCKELVLALLPLRKLAELACMSKEFRNVYIDLVKERNDVVEARLQSDFPAAFRNGLLPADTALPRDQIVDPPVRNPSV